MKVDGDDEEDVRSLDGGNGCDVVVVRDCGCVRG